MKKLKKVMLLAGMMTLFIFPGTVRGEEDIHIGDAYISDDAYEACLIYGNEYDICPELLMAVIEKESDGNPASVTGDCKGLMQVSVKWHADRMKKLGVTDIFDEYGNILVATDYLSELFEKYEDVATVLAVYHGERNAVSRSRDGYMSEYTKWILDRSMELEEMHRELQYCDNEPEILVQKEPEVRLFIPGLKKIGFYTVEKY